MTISLIHATARPVDGKECQRRWLDSADDRARIEIVTAVDAGDAASRKAFPDAIVVSGTQGCVPAYNAAAAKSTGDILVQLDDDNFPPNGWDSIIESYMCNGADILHVGDKHRKDDLICHIIISRKYYETVGFFAHPSFRSVYCDNFHTHLARNWGYVDASKGGTVDLGWEHRNPSRGLTPEDEVARISNSPERYAHGEAVFNRLCNDQFVLAFTACDRPHFLIETLSSWEKTNLNLVTSVQFFIEPTDKLDAIHSVIDIFESNCPVPVIRHVNPEKYGVLRNPWELFHNLFDFQLAEHVILGEDDFIVSPDVLDFLDESRKQMSTHTMAVCAKWVDEGANEDPSTWHRVKAFSGNIWLTSRQIWKKYLQDTWDKDYSSGNQHKDGTTINPDLPTSASGWDWNFSLRVMPQNDLHCIVPTASRSFHIGTVGVHCTEEDYKNTTTHNFVREDFSGKYCERKAVEVLAVEPVVEIEHAYTSTGDAGDTFLSLATIKHLGGKTTLYLRDGGGASGIVGRAHLIRPLIEAQPYISAVKIWKDEPVEWESEGFRGGWVDRITNLAGCHAKHAVYSRFISTLPNLSKPWLTVEPDKTYAGRIICNRSPRYNNPYFPWRKIVEHYGSRLIFIGMTHEHHAFCESFGGVEYKATKDFLEVARMIAGSEMLIANQSACMTIAEGLKHPRILEGSLGIPDCCYPNATNAQYVFDGSMTLHDIDGSGELVIPQQAFKLEEFELNLVPRHKKGWGWFYQYEDIELCESTCENTAKRLRKLNGLTLLECKELVIRYNVAMSPKFFGQYLNTAHFHQCKVALAEAGCTDNSVFSLTTGAAIGLI